MDSHRNRPRFGKFDRVIEEVEQYLSEPSIVAHQPFRRVTVECPFDNERLFRRNGLYDNGCVVN